MGGRGGGGGGGLQSAGSLRRQLTPLGWCAVGRLMGETGDEFEPVLLPLGPMPGGIQATFTYSRPGQPKHKAGAEPGAQHDVRPQPSQLQGQGEQAPSEGGLLIAAGPGKPRAQAGL